MHQRQLRRSKVWRAFRNQKTSCVRLRSMTVQLRGHQNMPSLRADRPCLNSSKTATCDGKRDIPLPNVLVYSSTRDYIRVETHTSAYEQIFVMTSAVYDAQQLISAGRLLDIMLTIQSRTPPRMQCERYMKAYHDHIRFYRGVTINITWACN